MNFKIAAKNLAEKTKDTYSASSYRSWTQCAFVLLDRGFTEREAEAILRSKWTRWARDWAGKTIGTANDLVRFIEAPKNMCTDEAVAELVRQTFDDEPVFIKEELTVEPKLAPFKETDWMTWGGSNRFSDGTNPLIMETERCIYIVDGEGIAVFLIRDDEEENLQNFALDLPKISVSLQIAAAKGIIEELRVLEKAPFEDHVKYFQDDASWKLQIG